VSTPTRADLRTDWLTGVRTFMVNSRQDRPNLPAVGCPFCPGGLEAPETYDVRWFRNRWPAMPDDRCEVVLYTPQHDATFWSLGVEGARRVLDLWAERTTALGARPDVEYVLVFENRGREVGATIDHPHGQIYGYSFVPPVPAQEAAFARTDGCTVCDEIERELEAAERIVAESGNWVAWVPYASTYAYGMRFAPRRHVGGLPALDDASRSDLARLLVDTLARYEHLWPVTDPDYLFPYLLWFHQQPASGGDEWHLHAHVAPPLRAPGVQRYVASGELGSGTLANTVIPEDAARQLRAAGS
jgi:UDPglucose--hexose-1-phosphate uridylyltransferase